MINIDYAFATYHKLKFALAYELFLGFDKLAWHDEIKVWDRTFKCDCGVEMDRDVHAARNMVWFYENNVGVEHTKVKRLEMKVLVDQAIAIGSQLLSKKDEDSSF